VVRGTPPHQKFDPVEVTKEYAALLKQYRITTVTGDYYGAEWVAGAWRSTGITYVRSELPKSQIYLECVPLFTRGLVRLPDHAKLLRELRLLERQCHRGGKESVDHPKNGSDDYANSVCGVLRGLSNHLGYDTSYRAFQPGFVDEDAQQQPVAPDPGPMRSMAEWWKCMPRSDQRIPGSNLGRSVRCDRYRDQIRIAQIRANKHTTTDEMWRNFIAPAAVFGRGDDWRNDVMAMQ
jgi:hypothetical protein